jgi:hypothetical protein
MRPLVTWISRCLSQMRLRAKVDSTHAEVVAALRAAGRRVLDLSRVGGGVPDILVLYGGRLVLMEIKNPLGPRGGASKSKLNEAQVAFAHQWPVVVVRSAAEALAATGVHL